MNPSLALLQPYPFEKLAQLKAGCTPPIELRALNLSIGEPQHPTPSFIVEALHQAAAQGLAKYPTTLGADNLRHSIARWLERRFQLSEHSVNPAQQVLPVNGTREALFAFAQAVIDRTATQPTVLMPSPFYQIYEGAALLAGAAPYFINCVAENGFQPDFDSVPAEVWVNCQLLYICSPANPSGNVLSLVQLQKLIQLADEYDFVIAADECYSELYDDEAQPPVGLLQACHSLQRNDFKRCVVFHSLSKRSNAPGLRSGFVAGDAELLKRFLLYRTYHGCAMSLAVQAASIAAWEDETHVQENRRLYREKFTAVLEILTPFLSLQRPPASFYLWINTPVSDQQFTRDLFAEQNVTVLAGSYLSREAHGINAGKNYIRMALVPTLDDCITAAERMRDLLRRY